MAVRICTLEVWKGSRPWTASVSKKAQWNRPTFGKHRRRFSVQVQKSDLVETPFPNGVLLPGYSTFPVEKIQRAVRVLHWLRYEAERVVFSPRFPLLSKASCGDSCHLWNECWLSKGEFLDDDALRRYNKDISKHERKEICESVQLMYTTAQKMTLKSRSPNLLDKITPLLLVHYSRNRKKTILNHTSSMGCCSRINALLTMLL